MKVIYQNNSKRFKAHLFLPFILFFLTLAGSSLAQPDPPSLRCISVEPNGNVTLTWIAPIDTGVTFGGYHISYSNNAAGPFIKADSIFNYNILTTTITSVNANSTSLYFYIKTREGCCSVYSVPSDTLHTIRMIVTPISNEVVRLNWNRTRTPPLPTTLAQFDVYKELTTGTFSFTKSINDTTLLDTNYYCSKYINYQVTQGDISGCVSKSSVDGQLFRDTKGPAKPVIDTVSIDNTTGDVQIGWQPDSSADTQGYVIYEFNGISYDSISTVYGINNTFFNYTASQTGNHSEIYSIAAFDSCKNLGTLAENHNSIFLESTFEKCLATVSLTWNSYINLPSGISRYEIWIRENAGAWYRDGFVPATGTSYQKILTNKGTLYEFLIRVVGSNGKTASSNLIGVVADIFEQPDFLYIRSASVDAGGNSIKAYVDPLGDIKSYKLYRSSNPSGSFELVNEIAYTSLPDIQFFDIFTDYDQQQYFYKITALDSCDQELVESNVAGTAHVTVKSDGDFISALSWLDYYGWQGPTGHFNIYRIIDGVKDVFPFLSVAGDTISINDDVSSIDFQGNLCYVIEAVEGNVNTFGFLDSALSNIECAPLAPLIYIPNAFTPGGKNPVFLPSVIFDDPTTYDLRIYNRWGQLVFSSVNPSRGWDGKFNSGDAPAGIYVYQLIFKGFNKKEIRKTGTLTLLR